MKTTTKQAIKKHLDDNLFFILFGSVNLDSLRTGLRLAGLQRLPNEKRLKAMVIDLYGDKVTGKIGFLN